MDFEILGKIRIVDDQALAQDRGKRVLLNKKGSAFIIDVVEVHNRGNKLGSHIKTSFVEEIHIELTRHSLIHTAETQDVDDVFIIPKKTGPGSVSHADPGHLSVLGCNIERIQMDIPPDDSQQLSLKVIFSDFVLVGQTEIDVVAQAADRFSCAEPSRAKVLRTIFIGIREFSEMFAFHGIEKN